MVVVKFAYARQVTLPDGSGILQISAFKEEVILYGRIASPVFGSLDIPTIPEEVLRSPAEHD
jgi:hypothetical protein